jgi:LysR family transcriptional regulator, transcriptional activator of the cysJI operon
VSVNFDHLQLFRDVAHHRSVSKGAALNGVTQPAVSQHLDSLEKTYGVQFLDRSTRPLTVTEAGQVYYDFCKELLHLRQKLEAELEPFKGSVQGVVRVCTIYSVGLTELVSYKAQFHERFPKADLQVEYLRPEKVYEAINEDRADLGLVSYPEATKTIKVIPWREERMVVAAAPSHPFAGRSSLRVEDLEGHDFVGFDDDLPIAKDVKRRIREAGVHLKQVLHFDNIDSMKAAVALGSGLSILPEPILRNDLEQGRLVAIPLDAPGLSRPVGIVHLKRKKLNRATQSFLNLLVDPEAPVA